MRRASTQQRCYAVLIDLIELYLKINKPIGSEKLMEHCRKKISSATLRNHFQWLEKENYLFQAHASGGRIPTAQGWLIYAQHIFANLSQCPITEGLSPPTVAPEEIIPTLESWIEKESRQCKSAFFVTTPQLQHDYVRDIRLMNLPWNKALALVITQYGRIETDIFMVETPLNESLLPKMHQYFSWRLQTAQEEPQLSKAQRTLADTYFNDVMVRYYLRHRSTKRKKILTLGLRQLLHYRTTTEGKVLDAIFNWMDDQPPSMLRIVEQTITNNELSFWIGEHDLPQEAHVICAPFSIGPNNAGAIGCLAPLRSDYRHRFQTIHTLAHRLSHWLTHSLGQWHVTADQTMQLEFQNP